MRRISNSILECGSAVRPFCTQGFGFKGLFLGSGGRFGKLDGSEWYQDTEEELLIGAAAEGPKRTPACVSANVKARERCFSIAFCDGVTASCPGKGQDNLRDVGRVFWLECFVLMNSNRKAITSVCKSIIFSLGCMFFLLVA